MRKFGQVTLPHIYMHLAFLINVRFVKRQLYFLPQNAYLLNAYAI